MSVICVLAMAIMASREVSGLMGSCREAKKCCEGKDPECGVTKVTVMMTTMMLTMMMAMMIMIMILTIMLTMVMTMLTKANLNSIIMDPDDAPCYCDHNCLNMGDCCPDFKDYCGGELNN